MKLMSIKEKKEELKKLLNLIRDNCPVWEYPQKIFLVKCEECLKCPLRISKSNINGEPFYTCGLTELYWAI